MADETDELDVFAVAGVDELYARPTAEFVAARDQLAKELRGAGEKAAAKAVKALRRPTVVAAALNHVVRDHPDEVEELAAAGRALREAYTAVLSGERRGADLDEPAQRRRRAVAALVDAVVAEAGEQHREEAVGTLEAASQDEDALAALRTGRLTAAIPAPAGFGFGDEPLPVADESVRPPSKAERARAEKALRQAEDELAEAEARHERAQAAVAEAEEALARARADEEEAAEALEAARTSRDAAAEALAALDGT